MESKKKEIRTELNPNALEFGRVQILHNSEHIRTQYTPTIKLLKREPGDAQPTSAESDDRKANKKTLQQRTAAYAEARKRILGEESGDDPTSSTEPVGILGSGSNSPILAER